MKTILTLLITFFMFGFSAYAQDESKECSDICKAIINNGNLSFYGKVYKARTIHKSEIAKRKTKETANSVNDYRFAYAACLSLLYETLQSYANVKKNNPESPALLKGMSEIAGLTLVIDFFSMGVPLQYYSPDFDMGSKDSELIMNIFK